jgi:hypothetical protein
MQDRYGANAHHPSAVAYDILLQRAVRAVKADETIGVTIDDISGSTPKHNDYKDLLSKQHERLKQRGSPYQRNISFRPLTGPLRFMLSHHSDLVQVADLAAYNVHRQFRDYGEEWEREGGPQKLPTYPYFQRIIGKFRTGPGYRIQGYGIAKMPVINKKLWSLDEEEREGK